MSTKQAEFNAVEFGNHVGAPGWYDAFLAACSCERKVAGAMREGIKIKDDDGNQRFDLEVKISVTAFVKKAHVAARTVNAFLDAWNSAADDDLVPHADDLMPIDAITGMTFDPDTHTAEAWLEYFDTVYEPVREKVRGYGEKYEQNKMRNTPPTPEQVQEAIKDDPAIRQTVMNVIKHDPKVRQAARNVIAEHDAANRREVVVDKHRTNEDEFISITDDLRWAKNYLQTATTKAAKVPLHGDRGEIILAATTEIRGYVDSIESLARGGSFDDALDRLLDGGAAL